MVDMWCIHCRAKRDHLRAKRASPPQEVAKNGREAPLSLLVYFKKLACVSVKKKSVSEANSRVVHSDLVGWVW